MLCARAELLVQGKMIYRFCASSFSFRGVLHCCACCSCPRSCYRCSGKNTFILAPPIVARSPRARQQQRSSGCSDCWRRKTPLYFRTTFHVKGLEIEPREYSILTKSRIKEVFDTHMGAGALDHRPYLAAASVLPMRTNNYVVSPSTAVFRGGGDGPRMKQRRRRLADGWTVSRPQNLDKAARPTSRLSGLIFVACMGVPQTLL